MIEHLGIILAGIVVVAFTNWVRRQSKLTISHQEGGKTILRYPKVNLWIAYGGLLLSTFIAILGIFFNSESLTDTLGWLILPSVFFILGIPLIFTYYNSKIIFDDLEITGANWLGKRVTLQWNEVSSVKFASISQYLTLKSGDRKVTAHFMMVGLQNLLNTMESKLDPEITKTAMTNIKNLRQSSQ